MQWFLREMLECPACHGALTWTVTDVRANQIEEGAARCMSCHAVYPVREGIGLFLTPDLPRDDLWEAAASGLARHLSEHPEVERQLLDVPLAALAPADQFFRALVLEERGAFKDAQAAYEAARPRLYTPEYLACFESEMDYVVERLAAGTGPVVDLASGRGELAWRLIERLDRPIVITDFSQRILRRNRRRLEALGLYSWASLLAFDALWTPFKPEAVAALTTNLGLGNIGQPEALFAELQRVVSGTCLAVTYFHPEGDEGNRAAIEASGAASLLYRRPALVHFVAAGWQVDVLNSCTGHAEPTPNGVIIEGARIDGLPEAPTELEWCVLEARHDIDR